MEVTVAASSSYVGFLEAYARALVAADTPVSRLRRWTGEEIPERFPVDLTLGAMDAAMIHYNAAKEAFNFQTQATTDEAQARLDKLAGRGALLSGILGAGSTILAGGSSVSSKFAQWKLASEAAS